MDNQFRPHIPGTAERTRAGRAVDALVLQGGMFVEAVQRTLMPMLVADVALPGNPITFANPAFTALSGYSLEELLGQEPHFMNGAGTDPDTIERFAVAMREHQDATWEIVQYRKDGSAFRAMLFASPVADESGITKSHFLSYEDVTDQRATEESLRNLTAELEAQVTERTVHLQRMSETDPLTDVLNRRGFNRHAGREFERARSAGEKLVVLMMDIDNFKDVNDHHGHDAGDRVLARVAEVCARGLRSRDLFGRTGGEEFAFLLRGRTTDAALDIGNRLRVKVAACIVSTLQGDLSVTASFGIAHADPATMDLANAMNRADAALYEAKRAGRDCVRISA